MAAPKSDRTPIGARAVRTYLNLSAPTFCKFVAQDLLALVIKVHLCAHADNLGESLGRPPLHAWKESHKKQNRSLNGSGQ